MEYKYFKPFKPTDVKIKELASRLMNDYLYLSDEFRDWKIIYKILFNNISNKKSNDFWEIGEFGGILGFTGILEGWKCGVTLKFWDKKLWGTKFVREARELIKEIMNKYNLKRISTSSPDERIVKMAKLVRFKVEGRFKCGFKWNNKFYTLHMLRILKEEL